MRILRGAGLHRSVLSRRYRRCSFGVGRQDQRANRGTTAQGGGGQADRRSVAAPCRSSCGPASDLVTSESTQVAAVMGSKLNVSKAADLLSTLPGDVARRITYAMSMTDAVTPDAVERIGLSLAAQLDAEPPKAFRNQPSERVGAILNFSRATTRDQLLTALDEEDKGFAEQVRKSIFTFAHIADRMTAIDVPKITRDVDQETLAKVISGAISDADQRSIEFI